MNILGFSFSKISIERTKEVQRDVKINSKVDISDIKPLKADIFKTKEDLFGITFEYTVDYTPGYAKVETKGNVVVSLDPKAAKTLLKEWKDKRIPDEYRIPLFNLILRKSSAKLLTLEDEMNVPFHLPMPTFRKEEENQK